MKEKKQTILEWYQQTKQFIDASCNGKGECGRCKVRFLKNTPSPSKKDVKLLSEEEIKQGIRLACTTEKTEEENFIPAGEFLQQNIFVPKLNQIQIQTKNKEKDLNEKEANKKESNKKETNEKGRQGELQCENGKEEAFGIALDIGTTTLAMSCIGLSTGRCFGTATRVNHQRSFGADVISRIQAANEGKLIEMQQIILQDILEMLLDILKKTEIKVSQIEQMVIVGNTTMCHLLRGLSCKGLSQTPFRPVTIELCKMKMKELWKEILFEKNEKIEENKRFQESENFRENKNFQEDSFEKTEWKKLLEELTGDVTILPCISAFVGADIVSGIYACDMDLQEEVQMLLDVGTNGEMVLGNWHGFLVTSAPAGPVFEGGGISCGMPAIEGAVSAVKSIEIETEEIVWNYEVLGTEETKPKGICGSGLIDLTAELLKRGIIDENGTFDDEYFECGFSLPTESKENQIVFTQKDIRELQMGKAAIRAGMEILMGKLLVSKEISENKHVIIKESDGKSDWNEVDYNETLEEKPKKIYLAGGFGTAIRKESAGTIGLFPKECLEQIIPMGNLALLGAVKYLLDKNGETRVQKIVELAEEIYLAREADFEEKYILFMQFLV